MPPMSPCGYACDVMRSCYITRAKCFRDTDAPSVIHWYFTDQPFIRTNSSIVNAYWHADNSEWEDALGEVSGAPRTWRNGHPPIYAGRMGVGHLCGTAEQWEQGALLRDALGPDDYDIFGRPLCCQPNPPLVLGLGVGADMELFEPSPRVLTWGLGLSADPYSEGGLSGVLSVGWAIGLIVAGTNRLAAEMALSLGASYASRSSAIALPMLAGVWSLSGLPAVPAITGSRLPLVLGSGTFSLGRGGAAAAAGLIVGVRVSPSSPGVKLSAPGLVFSARDAGAAPGRAPDRGQTGWGLGATFGQTAQPAPDLGLVFSLSSTLQTVSLPDMPGTWTKYTIPYTALSGTVTLTLNLVTLAARTILHAIVAKQRATFQGPGMTSVQMQVGYSGGAGASPSSTGYYVSGVEMDRSPPALPLIPGMPGGETCDCQNVDNPWTITTTWVPSGANFNALTAGSVDIWLLTSTLP